MRNAANRSVSRLVRRGPSHFGQDVAQKHPRLVSGARHTQIGADRVEVASYKSCHSARSHMARKLQCLHLPISSVIGNRVMSDAALDVASVMRSRRSARYEMTRDSARPAHRSQISHLNDFTAIEIYDVAKGVAKPDAKLLPSEKRLAAHLYLSISCLALASFPINEVRRSSAT